MTISDNVTEIGDHAFGFTDDDEGNFHKIDGFTIKANFDSQAKKYAKENKISIEYLDGNKDMPYIIALIGVGAVAAAVYCCVNYFAYEKKEERKGLLQLNNFIKKINQTLSLITVKSSYHVNQFFRKLRIFIIIIKKFHWCKL